MGDCTQAVWAGYYRLNLLADVILSYAGQMGNQTVAK